MRIKRLRFNTPEVSHGNKSPQGHAMHTIANEWIIAAGTLWNDPLLRTQLAPLIRNNNKIIKDQRRDEDSLKKEREKDTFLCCHFSTLHFWSCHWSFITSRHRKHLWIEDLYGSLKFRCAGRGVCEWLSLRVSLIKSSGGFWSESAWV